MEIKIDMRKRIVGTSHGQATNPSVSRVGRGESTLLPAQIHSHEAKKGDTTENKPSESRAEFLQNMVYHWVIIPMFILIKYLALCIAIGAVMTIVLGMVAIGATIAATMVYYTYQMDIEDLLFISKKGGINVPTEADCNTMQDW
ncbi:hypothetical protein V501_06510 [Pseudogymnoascus sp. VKM F-4519 (FW-2642)]|nr:hypothetical protein V501_06510 [Pseudogymnoascus sp. VKM F-4519 (FW-2642)]